MTREDIIRMAREAGFTSGDFASFTDLIVHFGQLVAAAEREVCASICDRFQARDVGMQPAECAAAIRARGAK